MKDALGHGSEGTGIHSQGVQKTPQLKAAGHSYLDPHDPRARR